MKATLIAALVIATPVVPPPDCSPAAQLLDNSLTRIMEYKDLEIIRQLAETARSSAETLTRCRDLREKHIRAEYECQVDRLREEQQRNEQQSHAHSNLLRD